MDRNMAPEEIGNDQQKSVHWLNTVFKEAATGLQLLLQSPVTFTGKVLSQEVDAECDQYSTKVSMNTFLVKTKINGNLKGNSYLMLDCDELDRTCATGWKETLSENLSESLWQELKMDFLKEVNNLMSSTIIARLDDTWETKTICQVPKAYMLDGQEINRYIHFDVVGLNAQSEIKVSFYAHEIGVTIELVLIFLNTIIAKETSFDNHQILHHATQ